MIKKSSLLALLSVWCFSLVVRAETIATPLSYLVAMSQAQQQANYEQFYLFQEGRSLESWRYRHVHWDNQQYAQLLSLDGSREEFLQQDNLVGYFGDFQPFSLQTNKILDNRPMVLYGDFNRLEGYSFIDMGKDRIANRVARQIRIVPKDEFRYQYRLWIDEESKLLLKSELLDREHNVLELFRVINLRLDDQLLDMVDAIRPLILSPMIPSKAPMNSDNLSWQPKWLPRGFRLQSVAREQLPDGEEVDSQLYSDGLFSFTIYLSDSKELPLNEHTWQDGKTTVYTLSLAQKDLVLVGEIPLTTAQHILQNIKIKQPLEK
ncbi:MucB/RseB-like sigma(E) regulatory protein [Bibersteinia trehalosi]|uniref:MucB/RseB C-terminal domain-containing protein n=1 Tax=Bibersteinia trehalosi TaxID=47735 RepID=UPI00104BD6B5|nr:MucB/RseB C-terminal domain-containing protein [Bibersteinia trehalosi]TCT17832.1 MucB/RseB-like sigma(E) regulatory protein [Bibersteinia trehalosi]